MAERPGGTSALLIHERAVLVQPSLVRALGLPTAVVLQQLHWRLSTDGLAKQHEGERWTPMTYAACCDETGLTADQVRRAVEKLEELGVVISCQPEVFNRRKSYRIDYTHETLSPGESASPSGADATSTSGVEAASSSSQIVRDSGAAPPPDGAPGHQRKRTPRDDLFDALVEAFGPASTPSRARFYGRTVSQLVDARATPEQVKAARAEMRRRGWEKPSPEAMLKHWDDLLRTGGPQAGNPAARRFWEEQQ